MRVGRPSGALILMVLWASCAFRTEPWPGPPIPCADVFDLDDSCMTCAQRNCDAEMQAAYGATWMTERSFDGTGKCVGYLSCLCDCRSRAPTVESNCLDCGHYWGKTCRKAEDAASYCLSANCGGNACRLH